MTTQRQILKGKIGKNDLSLGSGHFTRMTTDASGQPVTRSISKIDAVFVAHARDELAAFDPNEHSIVLLLGDNVSSFWSYTTDTITADTDHITSRQGGTWRRTSVTEETLQLNLIIYHRSAVQPATPTGGNVELEDEEVTLTAPSNWFTYIPSGSIQLWYSQASVILNTVSRSSKTIDAWSVPVQSLSNFPSGFAGNNATIIYQRSEMAPTLPSTSTGIPAGWSNTVPTTTAKLWAAFGLSSYIGSNQYTWGGVIDLSGSTGEKGTRGAGIYFKQENNIASVLSRTLLQHTTAFSSVAESSRAPQANDTLVYYGMLNNTQVTYTFIYTSAGQWSRSSLVLPAINQTATATQKLYPTPTISGVTKHTTYSEVSIDGTTPIASTILVSYQGLAPYNIDDPTQVDLTKINKLTAASYRTVNGKSVRNYFQTAHTKECAFRSLSDSFTLTPPEIVLHEGNDTTVQFMVLFYLAKKWTGNTSLQRISGALQVQGQDSYGAWHTPQGNHAQLVVTSAPNSIASIVPVFDSATNMSTVLFRSMIETSFGRGGRAVTGFNPEPYNNTNSYHRFRMNFTLNNNTTNVAFSAQSPLIFLVSFLYRFDVNRRNS